jgi:predicted nucleotidyltransferase
MSKDEILSVLVDYKNRNAQTYGILEMGVFGSVARDQAGDNSDVDIFVKTATPNPFMLVHIKQDVEQLLHRRVDIVRLRKTMNPVLKTRIEKEGVYV